MVLQVTKMKLFNQKEKLSKSEETADLLAERKHIITVFKKHIDAAAAELGSDYKVKLQGDFWLNPIRVIVEIKPSSGRQIP